MSNLLTDEELKQFEKGFLVHCGRPADWDSCDDHDDCLCVICIECGGAWCDSEILGV